MYNAAFGGVLAQYTFDPRWTLGAEVFRQDAQAADQPGYTVLNAGGYLNFTPGLSLLFSAGRSIAGAQHTLAYLGLYWTWGRMGDARRVDGHAHSRRAFRRCTGGHGTDPYEQNTQQSPGRGRSTVRHQVHSWTYRHASSGMRSRCA